jgi:hypothetical protein
MMDFYGFSTCISLQVRKFRKGQRKDLDFLDDDKPGKKKPYNKEGGQNQGSGKGKIKR